VPRNLSFRKSRSGFSPGWVIVSYFLICGGVTAAAAGYWLSGARDTTSGHIAFFFGAALGGLLAGRASPHRSYLEPALAASLVVFSIVAFVHQTPMGKYGIALAESHAGVSVTRHAWIAGGVGFAGGLIGAIVGELTQPRSAKHLLLRWFLLGLLISAGALFVASTAAGIVLANEAAEKAVAQLWTGGIDPSRPLLSVERLALAAAATLAASAVLTGLVTQLGAPRQVILPAIACAFLVIGGAAFGAATAAGRANDLYLQVLMVGAAAAALALVGAFIAFVAGKAAGRL
jgi:hypothetical protein